MPTLSTTNTNNCTIMGTTNVTTDNRRVRRSLAIKLLLGVFVVLGSLGARAQCGGTPFQVYESFSSTLPTQGGTWVSTSVTYGTTASNIRTGTHYAIFDGLGDILRTPQIATPGIFSFWYKRSGTATGTPQFTIETSPDNTVWTSRGTTGTFNTTYSQFTVNLGALGLTNVYVRIRDTRASGAAERYVDDLSWTSTVSGDNTITSILGAGTVTVGSIPYSATGQTTCGNGNNITSNNVAAVCGSTSYYGAEDKIYIFTPTATGVHTILVTTATDDDAGIMLYSGCPLAGSGSTCIANAQSTTGLTRTLTPTLTSGVTYYLVVDNFPSPACISSFSINIDPPAACGPPTGLSASDITGTTADIAWVAPGAGTPAFYDWEIRTSGAAGSGPAGLTTSNTETAPTVSVNDVAGLTAATAYSLYVRTNCSGGAGTSTWAGPFAFTTTLDCSLATPLTCATPVTTGNLAVSGGVYNPPSTSCGFTTPGKEKLYTFTSGAAGTYTLNITGVNAGSGYNDYFFKVASGGCGPTGWTCIGDANAPETNNFTLAASTTYFILVDAESASGTANHTFQIDCPAACPAPTSVAAGSITSTTASISWTCASCTGTFELDYGPTGHVAGTGTIITGVTSPYILNPPLTPSTGYTVYVRQDCSGGGNGQSLWSSAVNFTTLVPPPANDDCSGAILLPVPTACSPLAGTTNGGTQSLSALTCDGFAGNANEDVWYSFVANNTVATITVVGGSGFDAIIDLRSGACNGTNIACADLTAGGGTETVNATGLTVGATYYIRVYDYGSGTGGTFTICVSAPAPVFTFSGTGNYTDAPNWAPAYPGPSIPSGSTVVIASGAICTLDVAVTNAGTITNNGTVINTNTLTNTGTFTNSGTYKGTGTFDGSVFDNTGGIVAPGLSPGCTVFGAGYTNGGGTEIIEIGGITPCSGHDQLQVTGTATLSGTLDVQLFGGYNPACGESYTIMTATSVSGTFATVNYPALPGGLTWNIAYSATAVTLSISSTNVQNINTGLYYCSIQAAIVAPQTLNGHVIVAQAGTYPEQVAVTKELTIRGANAGIAGKGPGRGAESIIDGGAGVRSGFVVLANNVTIDGFTVTGCDGTNANYESGIYTGPATTNVRIINNIVTDNRIGVYGLGINNIYKNNLFDANNRPGAAGGTSLYTYSSTGILIDSNEFRNNTLNAEILFDSYAPGAHTNATVTRNHIHSNTNNGSAIYLAGINGAVVRENQVSHTAGPRAVKVAGGNNNVVISYNNLNTNTRGIQIANDGFGINTNIQAHYNNLSANTTAGVANDDAGSTNVNVTCNWYGTVFGPTIATNLGGSGSAVTGVGPKIYANWLNYGTDVSGDIGVQLPTAITVTAGTNTTMANNHYRLLSNAIGCIVDNQTLTVAGTFNFGNPTALNEWAKGNDQMAGAPNDLDDYSILVPSPVVNATVTATALGAGVIQGPGDLSNVSFEGPFFFYNTLPTSSNQGWTISNLVIKDFDLSIGAFHGGGNTTAFNNFSIINNQIDIPGDLNATTGGEAGGSQNIGIHYSFGSNQLISGNIFNIDGTGTSDGVNRSTSIAMQSNTSGGTVYDGLRITNNTFTVTGDPDPAGEAVIRGIWENGHNTNADIEISGNIFSNASPTNLANTNRQFGMWQTSHSGATKNVVYKNNEFSGWNTGISSLGGPFTANTPPNYDNGELPVLVENNKFDKMQFAVVARKGAASTNAGSPLTVGSNSFTNFTAGGFAIVNEGPTGTTPSVCNWYGTTSVPAIAALNSGSVYVASFLNNGSDGPGVGFQPLGSCIVPPVHNVTQNIYYLTIQAGVNGANNGDSITVESGNYDEQVLVNKSVSLQGIGATRPVVNFTGTVSGKPTLFDVSVDAVRIDSFHFNVDLAKLKSAIIASGTGIDNIIVSDNIVDAYGTPMAGLYGDRNAVSINYGGPTNYRVASGGVDNITFTGNTVNGSGPASYFRAGVAADEAGGTFTGNTLQSINHDVAVRFASNGPVTISNNNMNGGGVELADQNAAAGTITVSNNTFNGAFAIVSAPGTAILRIRNNYNSIPHVVSGNIFNAYEWAVSVENMNNITLDNNTFNTASATAHAVVVNTKSISTNSNSIVQVPVSATMTNNDFNGTGNALTFANHDSDNDAYGTFTIGTAGNENTFASSLSSFVVFDGQTGPSSGSTFPAYSSVIGVGAGAITTMACWDQDIDIRNNTMDVGAGLQSPSTMNFAQRTTLESKLTHDPDNACLGLLTYFLPVHNLTQNTYYLTIQAGVNAANPNDVIEAAEWLFNERVTIDRPLTLQGIDSATTVLSGTGLAGNGNGITINAGITNVTIQKLAVRNFAGASGNANAGIYAIGGNDNLLVDLVNILDNVGGSGFYANGPVNNVTLTNNTSRGHTIGARGMVIWNGLKSNITITGNHVYGNNCCGIELQDGTATGVTMTNNNVHDNGDNGIGLVGLMGPVANIVSGNTVTNNGRFGMEIKNPDGNGAASGPGSIVISGNTVSRTLAIVDARDIAGIAVFRRGVLPGNVDVPTGVRVINNDVSGYTQPSSSDGFGIVLEGLNHTATGNILNGNDVGIQRQAGHLPYPGDGDQSNLADLYFGRGNSPITCGVTVTGNTFGNILANTIDTRNVGNSAGDGIVTNTNTGKSYCSIQAAIDDPLTLNGHTISASAGTYNEDVVVSKQLTIQGAGYATTTVSGPIGGGGAAFQVASSNVIIEGFTITRAGNNTTDWNNPGLNSAGVAVQGLTAFAEIRNNLITGNRTGIDINNSNGNNVHNNIIDNNRTGLIFRNQTDNTNLQQNFITNNWTIGVLFLDASGGTNVPVQQAQNSTFNNNDFSGNWYGDVQDRQSGGSLPAPGFNVKNFDCNWYGQATAPVVVSTNSTEPGYAAQIPVIYGGLAVPPGGQADIGGTASANIDFINWLTNGTDDQPATMGFQPVPGSCTGIGPVLNVNTNQTYLTIQSAINNPLTLGGHTLQVSAGTYAEDVVVNKSLTILGPNAAIDPCSGTRVAEAIVVPATAAIASGEIFHVAASNVTISGFTINGDNPALASGFTSTNGADIDAAEGITIYENGINNLTVTNNIIRNLSYFGVTLYGSGSGTPTSGHVVANNKIQDLGTYDPLSTIDFWGGGVLLYNNQYAAVSNNCMTNVRLGVQTGNFSQANPGASSFQVIAGNTVSARRRGIFHNLFYSTASPYTLNGNTITGVADVNETASWDGILLASMQATASTSTGNIINGAAITAIPTVGISVWNCQVAPLITGGTITGTGLGINVNNFEGYPSTGSNAGNTSATIDGVTVTGATIAGIRVNDNALNTNNATVSAEIRGNTNVSGSPAGILVSGSDASANVHDNSSTITGNVIGVDVNGGTVNPLYRNTISANGTGVRVINSGVLGLTTENFITNNTSEGIRVEATAGTIGNINNNDLSGNTGLAINNLAVPAVNATCNWFGSADGNVVFAEVSTNVNYLPYLTNGTDDQPGTNGFQPVAGSCGGPGEFYVNDNNTGDDLYTTAVGNDANAGTAAAPFLTIQKALLAASPGNTIYVDGGVYTTQVDINKSITIKGAGRSGATTTRIKAPAAPVAFTNANGSYQALIYAHGAGNNINIDSVLVDGDNGRTVSNYIGVYFFEADGSLTTSRVTAIRDAPFSGNQGGSAVYVNHTFDTNFPHTVTLDSNLIDDYQKTGLLINEINTHAIIRGNTITGQSITNVIAQNGIQIGYGAYATITGNTITGNLWNSANPHVYMSSAILLAGAGVDFNNVATGGATVIGGAGVLANNINGNESGLQTGDGGFGYVNSKGVTYAGDNYANNKVHVYLDPTDPVNVPVVANSYDKRVDNPVQTSTVFGSIQYGVDFASAGNTLNASAGTFAENVLVHTSVSINGAGQANTFVIPELSAPNICGFGGGSLCPGASNVFLVQADNVQIQNLTVDGDNPALTGIAVGGADVDARNGIITDHNAGVYNNLVVNSVTVRNIFFRGVYASSGGSFTFNNNTVTNVSGDPAGSIAMFNFGGAGIFSNNTVTNANDGIVSNWSMGTQYFGNNASNIAGTGIHTDNNGGFGGTADAIHNNSVTNSPAGGYGIMVFAPYLPVQVYENTITNVEVGLTNAGQNAAVTPVFTQNVVDGQSKPNSIGVLQTTDMFGFGTGNVSGNYFNNYITDNLTSLKLQTDAGNSSNIVANNNSITNVSLSNGVDTVGTGTATRNLTCNWWGASGGNALVTAVGEATNYAPWLKTGVDAQPGTIGFQPAGVCGYDDNLYVNDGSNTGNFYTSAVGDDNNPGVPSAPFRTINKAIAVAQPTGNTVWVDPGNYPENLVVNKEISFKGRWAGANVTPRFGAFVGLKASTDVESVVTAPVNDPLNNPNDLVKVLANNITFDGFTFDGNNPALAGASAVQDNLSLDIDSRRVFTNVNAANAVVDVNSLVIKNNILQNVAQRGISLSSNGPVLTGNLVDSNLVRNYGWDPVNGGQGVILFTNAYAAITNNTIDVTDNNIGLHLQNFYSNGTMTWSNNNVTVGQDAIGIHANLFYAPSGVLNIQDNIVNARTGVTGASDFTWGINVWSVQVGSTVNVTNNTMGNTGGEFARGINLWNLPTSNLVTVSGGSVSNAVVGINLDNVDPYFGAGSTTIANITGGATVTVGAGQTGVRARSATVNAVNPTGSATLNLNNVAINATGTAKGIEVNAPAASAPNMATVYLQGGSTLLVGNNTPVLINGDQAQLWAGPSTIKVAGAGANNAIQFVNISPANTVSNLVLGGGTVVNMNGNTAARAFAVPQYAFVEINAAGGWAVPSKLAGGLQTVLIDGRMRFTNGILSTTAVADTIEFDTNAADIMTGPNTEKSFSYILGRAKMLSRPVNNLPIDMLGANLAAQGGAGADVGNLVITRTTTASGFITPFFPGGQSIRTVWNINPSNVSASRSSVRYRYLNIGTNINGQNPAAIYAYRYTAGTWQKISASLTSALVGDIYTTDPFGAPSFSPWTLSSQATAYLPDFTPSIAMGGVTFPAPPLPGSTKDFIVGISEVGNAASTGQVQFLIVKSSAYTISWNTVSGTSNVPGPVANNNSDWTFTNGPIFITATLKPGVIIPAFGISRVGFTITRNAGVGANTSTNMSVSILPGTGGDSSAGNNSTNTNLVAQ